MDSYFLSPRAKKAVQGAAQRRTIYQMKDAAQERLREQETKTMTEQPVFNEAPASVNVRAFSPGGYSVQMTLRSDDTTELAHRLGKLLEWLDKSGYAPAMNGKAPTPDGAANICPIHSVPMRRHEKNGQSWYSHKAVNPDTGGEFWCRGKAK